jgi:glycine cleavage system pyridoxal-binding protein P
MFCWNCGAKNDDNALFCGECGTAFDTPQAVPENLQQQPPVTTPYQPSMVQQQPQATTPYQPSMAQQQPPATPQYQPSMVQQQVQPKSTRCAGL